MRPESPITINEYGRAIEIIRTNLRSIIVQKKKGRLKWNDQEGYGPYADAFHHPLAQLWFIWSIGGGFGLEEAQEYRASYTGEKIETPFPSLKCPSSAVVRMKGLPGEILDLIITDSISKRSGLCSLIEEKINDSSKIMIAGCGSVVSAYHLISRLRENSFKGRVDVFDISKAPLRVIEAYKAAGFFGEVEVRTFQRTFGFKNKKFPNIKCFNPEEFITEGEQGYDIVFMDTLGYYLSDPELKRLAKLLERVLSSGGLLFIRELGEFSQLPPEERILKDEARETDIEKMAENFSKWLRENFGFEVTTTQIKKMRTRLFDIPRPHDGRLPHLLRWLDHLFDDPLRMRSLYTGSFIPYPPDRNRGRVFVVSCYQKTKEPEKNYNYIQDKDQPTSIALSILNN